MPRPLPLEIPYHSGLVAHAGLGVGRPLTAPTPASLELALCLDADMVELDVRSSADGVVVLLHDPQLPGGATVEELTVSDIRRQLPSVLTLDEGLEILGTTPVMLDLKTPMTAVSLGRMLRGRRVGGLSLCTERLDILQVARGSTPQVPLVLSYPDFGETARSGVRSVLATMARRRSRVMATTAATNLVRATIALRRGLGSGLAAVCPTPWSSWLAAELGPLTRTYRASGLSLHHWLAIPEIVSAAHDLGLPVIAWTVNDVTDLDRVGRAGTDFVTTDRLGLLRAHRRAAPRSQAHLPAYS